MLAAHTQEDKDAVAGSADQVSDLSLLTLCVDWVLSRQGEGDDDEDHVEH
jgi:hypothetical protein